MFAVLVGDRFLMRCGFCALTHWLHSPAFAEVCSSARHSHVSALGRGGTSICSSAGTPNAFGGSLKQGWSLWQPGKRGKRGWGSPCHPAPTLRFPAALCPLPKVSAEQSGEGTPPHAAEGEERLSCQPDTGQNRCDKRDEKVVPCCGISLISLLASFLLRNFR